MKMFGETGIEVRSYGKSEFAALMRIGLTQLRKDLDLMEDQLRKFPYYRRCNRLLRPAEIEVYLIFFGHMDPPEV